MKNLTYIPFTRNRYFYGKLLTAEDFEQEQRYINDKRRLINRWMFGVGIVAGLEVIRVDDYNISLEMGLALDETGREILVEAPVIKKLAGLDGFEEATREEGSESLYLYIEYQETPSEPVHNIAGHGIHDSDENEYNKYQENYHLYVTDDVPEQPDRMVQGEEELRFIYDRAEMIRKNTYQRGICLAQVYLVKAGPFYMIDRIIPVPFGQYVLSHPLLDRRTRDLREDLTRWWQNALEDHEAGDRDSGGQTRLPEWQMAEGTARIRVPGKRRRGQCLYTEEISHGLGLGDVQIHLRLIWEDAVYSGADSVFKGREQKAAAAARLNPKDGTFVIGVRLLSDMEAGDLLVGWTVVRSRPRNGDVIEEKRISISPALMELKVREDRKLTAVCVNLGDGPVRWSVATPGGGTIDPDGTYHAPNEAGVYEITASASGEPDRKASAYVIVRE